MRVTLAQTSPHLSRKNLQEIVEITQKHQDTTDLIVFPELALSGYMLQDKLYEDAWNQEELTPLHVASQNVDIAVGAAMNDEGLFRNTALYFSEGKMIAQHIKVHLPNYGMFEEARYFEGGEGFEAFTCKGKKISMLVCEDLWHSSVHEELIKLNPDMIIVLVASPARGFEDEELSIEKEWYSIIKQVAKECQSPLLFVNRVGFEDGLGFWGGSCIVNKEGVITEKLPKFDAMTQTFEIEDI